MIDAIPDSNISAASGHLEALILASEAYTEDQKAEAVALIHKIKASNPLEVFGLGLPSADFADPGHVEKAFSEPPPQFLEHAIRAVMSGAGMCDVYQAFVNASEAPAREIWSEEDAPKLEVRGGEPA